MEAGLLRRRAVFSFSTLATSSGRHSGSDLISHFVDKTQNLVQSLVITVEFKTLQKWIKRKPWLEAIVPI